MIIIDDNDTIRFLSYRNDFLEEYNSISIEGIKSLDLSRNGDLLLVSTGGVIRGFLVHALNIHCSFGTNVAFISSHREITMVDWNGVGTKFGINVNPDVLGLGPSHIVVGSGRSVHLYNIKNKSNEDEYTIFQLVDPAKVCAAGSYFQI